jgi:hypothetical protein
MIQTVTNLATGQDPVENFDGMGALTSAVANPLLPTLLNKT